MLTSLFRRFSLMVQFHASDHPVLKQIFQLEKTNSLNIVPTISTTLLNVCVGPSGRTWDFKQYYESCQNLIRRDASDSPIGGVSDSLTPRRIIRSHCVFVFSFFSFVQLIAAVIWTLQIYSISVFPCDLSVSTVDWPSRIWFGHLPRNLKNPTNIT